MDLKNEPIEDIHPNKIVDTGDGLKYVAKNIYHQMKEIIYRQPNLMLSLKKKFTPTESFIKKAVAELYKDGITILDGFIDGEILRELQNNHNQMISKIEKSEQSKEFPLPRPWQHMNYKEHFVAIKEKEVLTNDPFKHDIHFLHVALNHQLIDIIERYLKGNAIVSQALASRYYPMPPKDFGSWQWHHDAWGTRINMLLFLTDVNEDGQYLSYLKNTHKLIHSFDKTVNSRFEQNEIEKYYKESERVNCICKAGSIALIDSNGIHRGNRSIAMHRDTLIVSYGRGRYMWRFDIPSSYFNQLNTYQKKVLLRNPRIKLI